MLASTMQISNNNPTNTTHPPTGEHATKEGNQKHHPHPPTPPPQEELPKETPEGIQGQPVRLILQDPTVCLTPSPTNAGP